MHSTANSPESRQTEITTTVETEMETVITEDGRTISVRHSTVSFVRVRSGSVLWRPISERTPSPTADLEVSKPANNKPAENANTRNSQENRGNNNHSGGERNNRPQNDRNNDRGGERNNNRHQGDRNNNNRPNGDRNNSRPQNDRNNNGRRTVSVRAGSSCSTGRNPRKGLPWK